MQKNMSIASYTKFENGNVAEDHPLSNHRAEVGEMTYTKNVSRHIWYVDVTAIE